MNKIKSYKDFIKESFPRAYHDPIYGSDVFKIRYRSVNDLSNKKGSDVKPKPTNDLLDGFQMGDIVRGKSISDGSYQSGQIIYIGKDEDGENLTVEIETNGEKIKLAPATVTFTEGGDVGNSKPAAQSAASQDQIDLAQTNTFVPSTYENKNTQ